MISGKIVKEFELERQRFTFRYLRFEDYPQMRRLLGSLVKEGAKIGGSRKATIQQEIENVAFFIKKVEKKESVYLVIEKDGKIAGEANITRKTGIKSHIGELGIALGKEIRGIGLGKLLMDSVISEAKKNLKIDIIELEGFSQNEAALSLYKKFGFKVAGKVKRGIKRNGRYFDRVLMVKYLN